MLKTIIIDDEQDSREILANYLQKYCSEYVQIIGFGKSVSSGKEIIDSSQPDLVFLDIEMPFGNAFDLLEQYPNPTFQVIFVTAYEHYAIQALNLSAAYYLLKPINIDELINAVEKVSENEGKKDLSHQLVLDNIQNTQEQKMMLPTLNGFEIIELENILCCHAEDNFTRFVLTTGNELLICRTLKHFEQLLEKSNFMRIHRSHLINLKYVIRYTKGKGGFVTMKNGNELEISHSKKEIFLNHFI